MGALDAIKRVLTLSCDEASELLSNALDRPLSRGEDLAVRLHLLCCRFCRRYRRQIRWLHNLSLQFDRVIDAPSAGLALSANARDRIARALQDAMNEDSG